MGCGSRTGFDLGGSAGLPGGVASSACGASPGTVVTLASGGVRPWEIAVDGHNVYWGDWGPVTYPHGSSEFTQGVIMQAPLCGGASVTLAESQLFPAAIAVDSSSVYWANAGFEETPSTGAIVRAPIGGGAVTTLAMGMDTPANIAVNAGNVYFTTTTAVMAIPVDGGSVTTLASGQQPVSMSVDSTSVYWSNQSTPGAVMRIPLEGGAAATVVSALMLGLGHELDSLYIVGVADSRLYLLDTDTVLSVPVSGGDVTTLTTPLNEWSGVVADSSGLYWVSGDDVDSGNTSNGHIEMMPLSGGDRVKLATGPGLVPGYGIALNETTVVWTHLDLSGGGSVLATPK
jgi:hypothetical protein